MPLTNGSGSWIRIRIRSLLFSSLTFKMPAKNKFFNTIFSACCFLKVHVYTLFFKDKKSKRVKNSRIQGFSYYFCMIIEGSGSIPPISGSGSGRPKNMWIRWIRNTIVIKVGFSNCLSGSTTEGGKELTDSNFNLEGVLHWIPKQNTHSKALYRRF